MKVNIEKISSKLVRVTIVADIQVNGDLGSFARAEYVQKMAGARIDSAPPPTEARAVEPELLTIEETAKIMHIGRDKVCYLIRTGELRSIKIGKLRRISRRWIEEFIEQLETGTQAILADETAGIDRRDAVAHPRGAP